MVLHLDIMMTALAAAVLGAIAPAHPASAPASLSQDIALIQPVAQAYQAIGEVRAARRAIFDGAPERAKALVGAARVDMLAAQRRTQDLPMPMGKDAATDDTYMPLDASLVLPQGFQPTTEERTFIAQANDYIIRGEYRQAIAVLRAANINVMWSAELIPIKASLQRVQDAARQLGANRYYEASQALKAVEDSEIENVYGTEPAALRVQ